MLSTKNITIVISTLLTCVTIIAIPAVALGKKMTTTRNPLQEFDIPVHWAENYVEDYDAYEESFAFDDIIWETVVPENEELFVSTVPDIEIPEAVFMFSADSSVKAMTPEDEWIATLPEEEAWAYISNGIWTNYPTTSFNKNRDKLVELQATNTETITVRVWYWANPADETDMSKVTREKVLAVNSRLANTFRHIFEDIYNHPSKPIINIGDKAMGTWVLRGKNHNNNRTMSAHALGAAIDINPSTGSFYVDGTWYGNAYGQNAMPTDIWYQLPETHDKYHVLYQNSPIVEIFKSYGFYWGGDWTSGTDAMHLAYIGDGSSARATAIENYEERN